MKLPLSLLKAYLPHLRSVSEIGDTLTLLGVEVDGIHAPTPPFHGVVVAEVRAVRPHPNAANLCIAEVFDGAKMHEVVCGAPNCRAGMKTAFAKAGATLTDSAGKTHKIEATSIRGAPSAGMLCSASELSLYEDNDGILELPLAMQTGADALALLWDPVLELSLTPNLGHCMSALGIARELSAAWQMPMQPQSHKSTQTSKSTFTAIVDHTLCPRYMAQAVEHVQIQPSPFWLVRQLKAAGIEPKNNVVDVTNYIRLKTGQPLHAFDAATLRAQTIRVASSESEMTFAGLDGQTHTVPVGTVLIYDAERPIALAGILGGKETAVSDATKSIVLEAAVFDPLLIRKSAKQMGLRTESALRFEKGVDPAGVAAALEEAVQLIQEIAQGKPEIGRIDCFPHARPPRTIACTPAKINRILGTHLSQHEIESLLQRLRFQCRAHEERLDVTVPTDRFDVSQEIDLVEEVARLYGYNHIARGPSRFTTTDIPHDPEYLFETELRQRLTQLGLQELLTCDLISPKMAAVAPELMASRSVLRVLHSKSEEHSILRPSLLPGILQVVKLNHDHKNEHMRAFELGRLHVNQNGKPFEPLALAIALSGLNAPHHWSQTARELDFFDLKGLVENLLGFLRISGVHYAPSEHMSFHPGRQANVHVDQRCIGSIGQLHPALLAKIGIDQRVYYAELDAHLLQSLKGPAPKSATLPQFPASERDWTLPLEERTPIARIFDAIRSAHCPLLEHVELIDLYTGNEKRTATFRFVYRDAAKTVSFDEVESAHAALLQEVLAKTNISR